VFAIVYTENEVFFRFARQEINIGGDLLIVKILKSTYFEYFFEERWRILKKLSLRHHLFIKKF
jgi:hypothetical protein